MTAVCPNCGTIVQTKRALGTGRDVDPDEPIGPNEQKILSLLREFPLPGKWATVRQIQAEIFYRQYNATPVTRIGKHKAWNYVLIQSELSNLVGRGLVEMMKLPGTREFAYRVIQ